MSALTDLLAALAAKKGQPYFDEFVALLTPIVARLDDVAENYATILTAASTTSMTLGTGTQTCTVEADKGFAVGRRVTAATDASNLMIGTVSSYDSGTGALVFVVSKSGDVEGSGTYTSWTITSAGDEGDKGDTGDVSASAFLTALSGLSVTADRFPYFGGGSTAQLGTITSYMLGVLSAADAATAQSTLGLITSTLFTPARDVDFADYEGKRLKLRDAAYTLSALGNRNSATTLDLEVANTFSLTVTGSFTFTFSNPPATGIMGEFILHMTNGGSATVTWPAAVKWPYGAAPTLQSSGTDGLRFYTLDAGTTWHGALIQPKSS